MAAAVEPAQLACRALARRGPRARARAQPHRAAPPFIDDCETPVSRVPEAARANPEYPAFLLESAEQGQRVGRYSFIGLRPRKVVRWSLGDEGDPYAIAEPRRSRATARRRSPDMPPFAGGAVGLLRLRPRAHGRAAGRAEPGRARAARHGAHAHRRAGRLRPPASHTITILANVYADEGADVDEAYADARRDDRRRRATCSPARSRRADPTPRPRRPGVRVQHAARGLRGDGRAHRRVRPRRRRLPGRPVAALVGRRSTVDPFSIYRGLRARQPEPVHVLPGLPRLPGRRRHPRAAADGQRPARLDAADRRHAPARRRRPRRTRRSPRTCSPTRRSAPST